VNCPNCGRPVEREANICPHCGTPLPSTSPLPPTSPPLGTEESIPSPRSSTLARAGLGLGVGSLVLFILAVAGIIITWTMLPEGALDQFSTAEEIQDLLSDPEFVEALGPTVPITIATIILLLLASLAGLLGVIVSSLGLSQEQRQRTPQGRTFCIIGIVLSSPSLLCCVAYCILTALSLSAGGVWR
jgi:hypothetical protein